MDLTLFKEGFVVMVIGMGTVFVFLTIMIWVMNVNSKVLKIVNKYFPEEIPVDNLWKIMIKQDFKNHTVQVF